MVPVHVVYSCPCRACPYGNEGKGKRTWTLGYGKGNEQDHEGKGKRTWNLQGNERDHVRATIYWGMGKGHEQDYRNEEVFWTRQLWRGSQGKGKDNHEVEPPPGLAGIREGSKGEGKDNERVWPPPAIVDAWIRRGKGMDNDARAIDVWIGKGQGKDKGNDEVLVGHV